MNYGLGDEDIAVPTWEEAAKPDIVEVMKFVEEAEANGLAPEEVLSHDQMMVWEEFLATMNSAEQPLEHFADLTDYIDSVDHSYLGGLASDVINWVMWDEETRRDWEYREAEGIRLLGVSDTPLSKALFEGASQLVHPILAEATIDFHSRMMTEIWPPEGPVKAIVLGDSTPELEEQADRVSDYMNYQYTEDMPGGFEETDAMLFRLTLSGSCFKKTYNDPLTGKNVSKKVEASDFIVPYSATDLVSAPRFTHRYRMNHNTVLKHQQAGYFTKLVDVQLPTTTNDTTQKSPQRREIDSVEGSNEGSSIEDPTHILMEMVVDLEIPGMEDTDPVTGKPTGILRPYLVIVDYDSQKILRVQRMWEQDDEKKEKIVEYTHFRLFPGLGFYGMGLLHFMGNLVLGASGSLNSLLDSAAFSNFQGGYRSSDARISGDQKPLKPGEWRELKNVTAEDLQKAFFRVPYGEPSDVLFDVLKYLDEKASTSFLSAGQVMTGEANNNAPVGTTLALIEQGSKPFNAVHIRLHRAMHEEFRRLANLNGKNVPEEGYPYAIASKSKVIFAADFDERVDVIPVSDPNIISSTQRIHIAQAVLQVAEAHPDEVNISEAIKAFFTAIRVPNVDALIADNQAIKANQQRMADIEYEAKQKDIAKVQAEINKLEAERVQVTLTGMYTAYQAAQVAVQDAMGTPATVDPKTGVVIQGTAPGLSVATVAEQLFQSAGGKDWNGSPLLDEAHAQAQPQQPVLSNFAQTPMQAQTAAVGNNTSPMFPANPKMPEVGTPPSTAPVAAPASGLVGANAGIETQRADGGLSA